MKLLSLEIIHEDFMGYNISLLIDGTKYSHSNHKVVAVEEDCSLKAKEQIVINAAASQIADIIRKQILLEIENDNNTRCN